MRKCKAFSKQISANLATCLPQQQYVFYSTTTHKSSIFLNFFHIIFHATIITMNNTFLKRPYINITNENGRIIGNGANQGWFSNSPWFNVSGQGCGIISALDTLFYIKGDRIITKADYQQAILDFAKSIVFTKLFMHEFFGKFAIGLTPLQITKFLNKKLGNGYKVTYNGRYACHHNQQSLRKCDSCYPRCCT